MRLKILSYNIHSCFGADRRYDPSRIRDVILASDADVIGLQEVDSSLEVEDGVDQLTYLARSTQMHAYQGATLKRAYGAYGNAFLTKQPLAHVIEIDLTYRKFEPRGLIAADLRMEGRAVRVVNTHLGLKMWERRFQVNRVLKNVSSFQSGGLSQGRHPILVMGDFNEWFPWTANQRALVRYFGHTPRARSFPSIWPRFSLDRIFAAPTPKSFKLCAVSDALTRVASDHLPVLAEVAFD